MLQKIPATSDVARLLYPYWTLGYFGLKKGAREPNELGQVFGHYKEGVVSSPSIYLILSYHLPPTSSSLSLQML